MGESKINSSQGEKAGGTPQGRERGASRAPISRGKRTIKKEKIEKLLNGGKETTSSPQLRRGCRSPT